MKHTTISFNDTDVYPKVVSPSVTEIIEIHEQIQITPRSRAYKVAILDGWAFTILGILMAAFSVASYIDANGSFSLAALFTNYPEIYVALAALILGVGLNRWAHIMRWWNE